MSSRTDARFSTYSGAPSIQPSLAPTFSTQNSSSNRSSTQAAPGGRHTPIRTKQMPYISKSAATSTTTLSTTDPKTQDIKAWSAGFERLQDARMEAQRYTMTSGKSDEVSKLALGAKLERALGRRMVGQDASFTKKQMDNEKGSFEVEVN